MAGIWDALNPIAPGVGLPWWAKLLQQSQQPGTTAPIPPEVRTPPAMMGRPGAGVEYPPSGMGLGIPGVDMASIFPSARPPVMGNEANKAIGRDLESATDDGVTRIRITPERRPVPAGGMPPMQPPAPPPGLAEGYDAVANTKTPPAPMFGAEPAAPPNFWERNKDIFGTDGRLWDALAGFGQGIAQAPPGTNDWGVLNMGASGANRELSTAPDRALRRKLLEGQAGEISAKATQRKAAYDLAKDVTDPIAKRFFQMGMYEKGMARLTEVNPDEARRVAQRKADEARTVMEATFPIRAKLAELSGTKVTVNNKGETKYDETLGKKLAEDYIKIQEAGDRANSNIAMFSAMRDQLTKVGYTGFGAETFLGFKKMALAVGIKIDDKIGPAEAVQAFGNQLTMRLRSTADGGGMPGAMSDADRVFLKAATAGLDKTPEGNATLLDYAMRVEKRALEVRRFANEYATKYGRIDARFRTELDKWAKANPLFPEGDRGQSRLPPPPPPSYRPMGR